MGDTTDIHYLLTLMQVLADRLPDRTDQVPDRPLRGEIGSATTETVIIIAGLAALALAVVAIIVTKVTDKANTIAT